MATLVLLSESYPYGGVTEPSFIGPEIEALASEFDRVIIAPVIECGPASPLPANVAIERALLNRPGLASKASTLLSPTAWRHLNDDGRYIHSFRQLRAALAFTTYTLHYRKILRQVIKHHALDLNDTLFYSFWFEYHVAALAGIPGAKIICRAHGHDIYDSQNPFLSHSWREYSLNRLLACYPASDHGREYIATDYPSHSEKVKTRVLGSKEASGTNPRHPTEEEPSISILSIARLSPEKGVMRLAKCLNMLSQKLPIRWIHIGDGPQMAELQTYISSFPQNAQIELLGRLSNEEIHHILASRHIDFTALLSYSEGGLPIAACESLSYGVPVVASAVGGLPEIVDDTVGVLLSPNPTPEEFCQRVIDALPRFAHMRAAARRRWESHFDAAKLRTDFAREIRAFLP